MNYYKIIVSYDGTNYYGWQRQNKDVAVANILEDKFKEVFHKEITIIGASRTDAGVHAYGQVALFKVDFPNEVKSLQILQAWSNVLPPDIVIRDLKRVSSSFHPQKNVLQKTYFYNFTLKRPLPFEQRYVCFYRYPINVKKLKKALKIFIGKHDFRSFCTGTDLPSTIKTIDSISLKYIKESNQYRIVFKGQSFLRYMIRRIVGACLNVSSRKNLTDDYIKDVLEKKDPQHTLPKAPGKGLILYNIKYKK